VLWTSYVLVWALIFLPSLAYGDMNDFATAYLNAIESKKGAVFFSQCKSKINNRYTATLIFEVGNMRGLLIERNQKFIVNLATVELGTDGLVIEETHGGVYSYERVKRLVDELGGYQFRLLLPFRVKELGNLEPRDMCLNEP
jgi:hypothetical protein